MDLPDPVTLTAEQCTGDVYIRLSEATVAPVLFAEGSYANALNFNHMVLGNTSEIPELLAAFEAMNRGGSDASRQNFREELGDQTWYTAGELRAAGLAHGGNMYTFASLFDAAPSAPTWQPSADGVRGDIERLASINGTMADVAKRALYYIKPETLSTVATFPTKEQSELIVVAAVQRLAVLANLAAYTGWSLREVMAANIRKLRGKGGRFAEKFEACRALHRNTTAEMEAHG